MSGSHSCNTFLLSKRVPGNQLILSGPAVPRHQQYLVRLGRERKLASLWQSPHDESPFESPADIDFPPQRDFRPD